MNTPSSFFKSALAIGLLFTASFTQAQTAPATCTATIGSPANGASHFLNVTWAAVAGATSYTLETSPNNSSWTAIYTGAALTYSHDAGGVGNTAVYYRVNAITAGNASAYTQATQFPIYTACDQPALPLLSNAQPSSMQISIAPETPTANPATTTYSLFCTLTGQYVQANGTLAATEVFQTAGAWGTTTVTGLTGSTSYCFYAKARNQDGDTRMAIGANIMAAETFTTSSNFTTGSPNVNLFSSPSSCSTGGLTYSATGGCTNGNVGKTGSFNNFFGCYLRTPQQNCTGNSTVVLNFDISNSYFANQPNDKIRFYMWVDNGYKQASTVKINGVDVTFSDVNGKWLKFDQLRSCVNVDVTFDLTTSSNLSNILFYLEPSCGYNNSNVFSVKLDNVSLRQGGTASACLATTACTAPSITASPSNQNFCEGGNASFTMAASGSVGSYQWEASTDGGQSYTPLSNGGVYSGTGTATLSITGATSAMNGNLYRAQVQGSCSGTALTTAATLNFIATPATPTNLSGNTTICGSSNNTYSVIAVSGASSYTWSLPNGWSGTSTQPTISTTAGNSGGSVSVSASNACGTSAAQTLTVNVTPIPASPQVISGNATLCSGSTNGYSVTSVTNATSYTWSLPSGWSGSSVSNSISAVASANSGTVSVTANNSCGSSMAQTLTVSVNAAPATPGTISGNGVACLGTSNTYTINAVSGAVSYNWTLPNGWTGTSTATSITATANTSSGNVTVAAVNSCGTSSAQSLAVSSANVPATPGNIGGSTTVCAGTANFYSISFVSGATSYTWVLPSGWSGTSSSLSISTTASGTSGNITVAANNSCGTSATQTLAVTASSIPAQPLAISGNTALCAGSTTNYLINAVANAASYTWSLPVGWTGSSTSTSIAATASANGGTVSVSASNTCGTSAAQTLSVNVTDVPATPAAIVGNTTLCEGETLSLSITPISGAITYTWTAPLGWSGTSTAASIQLIAGATSGTITVAANNACGSSAAQSVLGTANPLPQVAFNLPSICSNALPYALIEGSPAGGIYSGPGLLGNVIGNAPSLTTQTYTYTFTDANNCQASDTANVYVDVCTSIPTLAANQELSIYPNPALAVLNIEGVKSSFSYSIMSVFGKLVAYGKDRTAIEVASLAPGLYFIQLWHKGKLTELKFMKE